MIRLLLLLLPGLSLASCQAPAQGARGDEAKAPAVREREIEFSSGSSTLKGTLFQPAKGGDFPAVVVLAGSDRSERGPLRLRIARHFAANGVAALVYDSAGTGDSTGDAMTQTRGDRVAEALHAIDRLKGVGGIRAQSIGLFGGSEGADIALLSAARSPDVAFAIAVSGSLGVPMVEVAKHSAAKAGRDAGLTPEEIEMASTCKEILFAILSRSELVEWSALESRVTTWQDPHWTSLLKAARQWSRTMAAQERREFPRLLKGAIEHFKGESWFKAVDPENAVERMAAMDDDRLVALLESGRYGSDRNEGMPDLSKLRCPLLAIWGQEDSFLPPDRSAAALRAALEASEHPDFRIRVIPNATHFLTVPGSAAEFVPGYPESLTEWVRARFDRDVDGRRQARKGPVKTKTVPEPQGNRD